MAIAFSKAGIGSLLADTFDQAVRARPHVFPNTEPRGQTLVMVADFGGQHKGQHFDTYAFLILDLDRNGRWVQGQRLFRQTVMPNARRMSFKAMNDNRRRQALFPFLGLSDGIEGWLVLFGVSKAGGSLFGGLEKAAGVEDLFAHWKPSVRERLLRIMHLSAFLLSGLSSPQQDVLWFIDEDEVAANAQQLTQLTNIFGRVSSNSLAHDLRHIRCGTTRSDDGTLSLEDLVAVCDLAAGAYCEVATAMIKQGRFPRRDVITALPADLSWKTRVLTTWLAADSGPLQRLTCSIELESTSPRMRATMMRWHAVPAPLGLPDRPFGYTGH